MELPNRRSVAMGRKADLTRNTTETRIQAAIDLDGRGRTDLSTGIAFFDHMLKLMAVHGFLDLQLHAEGDLDVDFHHTVEDVGIVLGQMLSKALGDRKGIRRFGFAVTPMDEALATATIDLSNRPFLVFLAPSADTGSNGFDFSLAKEFFRAFAVHGGMNLHIEVRYGENRHHMLEAVFKSVGRALNQAVSHDRRIAGVRSTKGSL